MSENKETVILKVVILGDAGVGKTSLIKMYTENDFKEDYRPTLGVNIVIKVIEIEELNIIVRIVLWDVTGQIEYEISRKGIFERVSGALLVYDITNQHSLEDIKNKWLKDLTDFGEDITDIILIGNKIDLLDSRVISAENGQEFANSINTADFVETSAKNGKNVKIAFKNLVNTILRKRGFNL